MSNRRGALGCAGAGERVAARAWPVCRMTTICIATVDAQGEAEGDSSRAVVPWWSFTKTLIAAAALRLAEQGRLDPARPLAGRAWSLRQLLQHRAGIPDYGGLPAYHAAVARGEAPWSEEKLLRLVPAESLLFPPGAGWAYSNVGYLLARRAIEAASGAGLADALRELVLGPLGLRCSRLAVTREDMHRTVFAEAHGYHPGWVFHGVVIGPVAEAALALHRILAGGLLAPASLASMLDRHPIGGPVEGRPWVTTGYGLGLMTGTMQLPGMERPVRMIGHSAGGPGSVGAVYHAPDSGGRTAAAFMAGTDEGVTEEAVLRHLVER